jgi:hypothetical protein
MPARIASHRLGQPSGGKQFLGVWLGADPLLTCHVLGPLRSDPTLNQAVAALSVSRAMLLEHEKAPVFKFPRASFVFAHLDAM